MAEKNDLERDRELEKLLGFEKMKRDHKVSKKLADDLTMLRTNVKYIMFDLEATRRENKVLRDTIRELRGK